MRSANKMALATGLIVAMLATPAHSEDAAVKADFQPLVDGAITISEVAMPADGFVVVRKPKDNKVFRGDVLAAMPLKAGTHKDVVIVLDPAPSTGDTLGIILHKDDATEGTYEFEIGKPADEPFFIGKRPVLEVIGVIE